MQTDGFQCEFQYDRAASAAEECRKISSNWRGAPFWALNGKFLRCGENVLQFKKRMDSAHPGLESVFLLGNFGVKSETDRIELTAPVISLVPEDWCMQGLPFDRKCGNSDS